MQIKVSMRFWLVALSWILFVKLAALAAPLPADPKAVPAPAEKVRKALDQVVNIEFAEQPLHAALSQLGEQTKIKFVLDRMAIAQMGVVDPEMPVTAKLQDTKVRSGLRTVLSQYGLSFVVLEDTVLVTTQDMADYRQVQQRIDVDLQEVPLHQALMQLARKSGCNLVLDRRIAKEARETLLTLNVNDAALETVVRIVAAEAGLTSVRMGNVLFVTTDEKAAKLRAEPESRPPGVPGINGDGSIPGGIFPGGFPGGPAFIPPVKILPAGVPAPQPAPAQPDKPPAPERP